MRKALVVFVVLAALGTLLAAGAFEPAHGRFDSLRGVVADVVRGVPTTVLYVDAGGGAAEVYCYDTYSPGIRQACDALSPGDTVLAGGDLFLGTGWTTFLVTRIDRTY